MSKPDINALYDKVIANVRMHICYYHHDGESYFIFALYPPKYHYYANHLAWYQGKSMTVIGSDDRGNFYGRHCDGSIRFYQHQQNTCIIIASSERDFLMGIKATDSEMWVNRNIEHGYR